MNRNCVEGLIYDTKAFEEEEILGQYLFFA